MSVDERTLARQQFEALSDELRNRKIGIAVKTASTAYAGFSIAGPIGAAVGGALGLLVGFWGYGSYRGRVYAEYEAAGLLKRPHIGVRSVWASAIRDDPAFLRFPYAALVGDVVLDVLEANTSDMSEAEVEAEAYAIVETFHQFRRDNPDIPVELAAEVILLMNDIMRDPATGEYTIVEFQEPPPVEPPLIVEPPERPQPGEPLNEVRLAWGLAAGAMFIYLVRRKE